MNKRVQRQRKRRNAEVRNHLIAVTLLVLLGAFFIGAIILAALSQVDHSVCRDASPEAYTNLHCQEVTGGVK